MASPNPSSLCSRDTNCNCRICEASINATLDLLPLSVKPTSKPSPPQTPPFFNPSTVSTPLSNTSLQDTPYFYSNLNNNITNNNNKRFGIGLLLTVKCCVVVLCLSLVWKFLGYSVVRTKLSVESVRKLGEKSLGFDDLKGKLGFLNHELQNVVGGDIIQGGSNVPNWEIVKDGLMLRSRSRLYKSEMEEVSIWGWPLQTSGMVSTDFGTRSFTVLSGRVAEVLSADSSCLIRTANSSWEQGKWSASVWRLDENTWILEYERKFVFDDSRPFSSSIEFLRFKMMKSVELLKQLWKLSSDNNHLAPT